MKKRLAATLAQIQAAFHRCQGFMKMARIQVTGLDLLLAIAGNVIACFLALRPHDLAKQRVA